MIQKLRAWLLDIAREAIRLEMAPSPFKANTGVLASIPRPSGGIPNAADPKIPSGTGSWPSDLSFEAAQDAALEELRKNYDA